MSRLEELVRVPEGDAGEGVRRLHRPAIVVDEPGGVGLRRLEDRVEVGGGVGGVEVLLLDLLELEVDDHRLVLGEEVMEHLELLQALAERRAERVALLVGVVDGPVLRRRVVLVHVYLEGASVLEEELVEDPLLGPARLELDHVVPLHPDELWVDVRYT